MSDKILEKIKDKLRKLMNHEESAREIGNEDEANTFAAKISSLMLQYEIEVHEMTDHSLGQADDIGEENLNLNEVTRRHESHWVVNLYHGVAKYNFCEVILSGKITKLQIILIGEPMNREVTHYICNQLLSKFRFLARKSFKVYIGLEKRNTYIRGFLKGAAQGVTAKLREEHLEANKHQQVQGIILAKDIKLSNFMEKRFPNLGRSSAGRRGKGSDGAYQGHAAGKNVNINKGVGGRSSTGGRLLA